MIFYLLISILPFLIFYILLRKCEKARKLKAEDSEWARKVEAARPYFSVVKTYPVKSSYQYVDILFYDKPIRVQFHMATNYNTSPYTDYVKVYSFSIDGIDIFPSKFTEPLQIVSELVMEVAHKIGVFPDFDGFALKRLDDAMKSKQDNTVVPNTAISLARRMVDPELSNENLTVLKGE